MLLHAPNITIPSLVITTRKPSSLQPKTILEAHKTKTTNYTVLNKFTSSFLAAASACLVLASSGSALSAELAPADHPESADTLSNIPQTLSGECLEAKDCKKARIQRPKSRKAESCTIKCVTTCIRGGEGSPGEGPLNIRRPLVVFKPGFRSRHYCLVECSDICNLIGDGDEYDWP